MMNHQTIFILVMVQANLADNRPDRVNYFMYFDGQVEDHTAELMLDVVKQTSKHFSDKPDTLYTVTSLTKQAGYDAGYERSVLLPLSSEVDNVNKAVRSAIHGNGRHKPLNGSLHSWISTIQSTVQWIETEVLMVPRRHGVSNRNARQPRAIIFAVFPASISIAHAQMWLGQLCRQPLIYAFITPESSDVHTTSSGQHVVSCRSAEGAQHIFHKLLYSDYLDTELDYCVSDEKGLKLAMAQLEFTFFKHERWHSSSFLHKCSRTMKQVQSVGCSGTNWRRCVQLVNEHDKCTGDLLYCYPIILYLVIGITAFVSICAICGVPIALYFGTNTVWVRLVYMAATRFGKDTPDEPDLNMSSSPRCGRDVLVDPAKYIQSGHIVDVLPMRPDIRL